MFGRCLSELIFCANVLLLQYSRNLYLAGYFSSHHCYNLVWLVQCMWQPTLRASKSQNP